MDLIIASDIEVCKFLAAQIRDERQKKGYTQATMANKSGISLRTYKRIELTGTGSIKNLIAILRALERIRAIEILFSRPANKLRSSLADRVRIIAESDKKTARKPIRIE